VPTSWERVSREGGYCTKLYPEWHKSVLEAREIMENKLVLVNIVNSALLDWFYAFSHFKLST
jgi:hypothetical protein